MTKRYGFSDNRIFQMLGIVWHCAVVHGSVAQCFSLRIQAANKEAVRTLHTLRIQNIFKIPRLWEAAATSEIKIIYIRIKFLHGGESMARKAGKAGKAGKAIVRYICLDAYAFRVFDGIRE